MQIGRFEIEIMVMRVSVTVMVTMAVSPASQNEHTDPIYNKTKNGNNYGLVEYNFYRINKPQYTFKSHKNGENGNNIAPVKPPKALTLPVPKLYIAFWALRRA